MESTTVSLCIIVCVSTIVCETDVERIDTIKFTEKDSILPSTQPDYIRLSSSNLEKTIPIEQLSSTKSYEDLAKNQELLKFVARNGYQVWKKMLISRSNSTYFDSVSVTVAPSSTLPSNNDLDNSDDTIDNLKSDASNNKELSEFHNTKNIDENKEIGLDLLGEVLHNDISNLIEPVHLIPVYAKEESITEKPITQKITTRKSKKNYNHNKPKKIQNKILIVRKKKTFFGTNIIGKVVISGFKGLLNGISSLFGWWA